MRRTWTIIGAGNVAASFKWYQSLLGLPETAPAHDYFGQILDSDGTVLLCLHAWGAHEHPSLTSPARAEPGNGLLLFFRVDDFDQALSRARTLVAALDEEPHVNPSTGTAEFSVRDPDGYCVTISALSATGTGSNSPVPAPDYFRALEEKRTRALVAQDMETTERLHAYEYQLITPAGTTFNRADYLAAIAAGPFYAKWEAGPMEVRCSPEISIVRYVARLEFPSGKSVTCWHTDSYELRDGRWQAVWSQATAIPPSPGRSGA